MFGDRLGDFPWANSVYTYVTVFIGIDHTVYHRPKVRQRKNRMKNEWAPMKQGKIKIQEHSNTPSGNE